PRPSAAAGARAPRAPARPRRRLRLRAASAPPTRRSSRTTRPTSSAPPRRSRPWSNSAVLVASGAHVGDGLRPQDVLHPPVEGRGVLARLDAGAVVLRERDPRPRHQPQQRVAQALELALAEAVESAALDELLRERGESRLAFDLPLHDQRLQSPPRGL